MRWAEYYTAAMVVRCDDAGHQPTNNTGATERNYWLIMPPPPSVCLTSVAYIGRNSRTERPRKTKIGTEVAHVTCDSDTTFKVKGQLVADVLNSQHAGTGE